MPWHLVVTRRAERDLAALPVGSQQAIREALERLTPDPGGSDLSKLQGRDAQWRLRVGQWRAILRFDNAAGLIVVLRVLPRGRAYRR